MKVLVAGAAGFLGSHVCEYYAMAGDQVVGMDNLTYFELGKAGFNPQKVREYMLECLAQYGVEFHCASITDANLRAMARGCDLIVNCAAQPTITLGFGREDKDIMVNILGTARLLDAARWVGAAFINCSTIHVYGNEFNKCVRANTRGDLIPNTRRIQQGVAEDWPLFSGDNVTSLHISKVAAEWYCDLFHRRDEVPVASFRLTGMYGTRQLGGPDHGWMANMAIRAVMGRPITVYRPAGQVRDVLYCTDAVRAMALWSATAEPQRESGIFNIGGGPTCSLSIRQYLEVLAEILGEKPAVVIKSARPYDLHWFVCDNRKAELSFGWTPEVRCKDGIRKMLAWIQGHRDLFRGKDG